MNERIIQTETFVKTELRKLASYRDNTPRMAEYRTEHSFRVAHLAATIAEKEGFDTERAYVAGLLHDIGYSVDLPPEEYRNHGRVGAKIARPFLTALGYSAEQVNEMCFGIAIHVDDKSDFPGERTPLALTVGDADNIDRFDAFRLYEGLQDADYRNLPLAEQEAMVNRYTEQLTKFRHMPCGTASATAMWQEKMDFYLEFYRRLKAQIDNSR